MQMALHAMLTRFCAFMPRCVPRLCFMVYNTTADASSGDTSAAQTRCLLREHMSLRYAPALVNQLDTHGRLTLQNASSLMAMGYR